jgi:hypothetical protein
MKTREARELGRQIAERVADGDVVTAYALLAPVLAQRTRFPILGEIGKPVGSRRLDELIPFLDEIASHRTEGGWVVMGSALEQQLERDLAGAFAHCRRYIIAGDIWYAADILGERVPGPALVVSFDATLEQLRPWRTDANRWVRRTVGVAVHFWAKRSRGAPELAAPAETLLEFLTPLFGEWEMDAVKGVGWGLKTLGRHYPSLVASWLGRQLHQGRRHRALMVRKARTFLPGDGSQRGKAVLR